MNMEMQSPELAELAKALVKAQSEMESVKKGAENPFFKSKYADLASVREASMEILNRNGLCIIQTMANGENKIKVITTLLHSSGQFVRGELGMVPAKNDPQAIGSVISYFRRYSWQAIIGLSAEDDDANSASQPATKPSKFMDAPAGYNKPSQSSQKPSQTGQKPSRPATETQSITLIPENVGEKTGQSAKGPWTRTYFKYEEQWFSTFDTKLAELLKESSAMASEIEVVFTPGDKGNNIETVTFVHQPPASTEPDGAEEAF